MGKETKKTIMQFVGAIVLIVAIVGGLMFLTREAKVSDGEKFKKEYESLNGTTRKSDGAVYGEVTIDKDNPITYVTAKEAIEVLESEKAIMYVGAPWCPWCRNAVSVLFELAKEYDVDKIYYLELDDIKSNYEVKNGQLEKKNSGTDDYYKLLEKLGDRLEDYVLTGDDGKKYDTGEKRIYMPYVIAVRDGNIVADKVGTVTLDDGQSKYEKLTDEQHVQLSKSYKVLFEGAYGSGEVDCDEEACN